MTKAQQDYWRARTQAVVGRILPDGWTARITTDNGRTFVEIATQPTGEQFTSGTAEAVFVADAPEGIKQDLVEQAVLRAWEQLACIAGI